MSDLDRVNIVGPNLFEGCTSLQSVNLSDALTDIPDNMFKDCTSLKYIYISNNVTSISDSAFDGTKNLQRIIKFLKNLQMHLAMKNQSRILSLDLS